MISYRFVPISSLKGVLFFETPGSVFSEHFNILSIYRRIIHQQRPIYNEPLV